MIRLSINGTSVEVEEGSTIMDAALKLNITIPTMCFLDNEEHFPSCMVCIVRNNRNGKFIPACSTRADNTMEIITDDEEVKEARKTGLELLLSDHVGECEAPCQTNCPASMNIPLMNRLLAAGRIDEALRVVKTDIALPAVLGRICPAPCERACRRRDVDEPVSICHLKRYAADFDLAHANPYQPEIASPNGKKVAIAGTGPAGLSTAYFLLQKGYDCVLYDSNPLPGGALRYAIPEERLPKLVLDMEIDIIKRMGAQFIMNHELKEDAIPVLLSSFDAVVLATGENDAVFNGLEKRSRAFITQKNTHRTKIDRVFAIGSAIKPGRVAIRAVAHGKQVAMAIDQYLNGKEVTGEVRMFNSRFGKMLMEDLPAYMAEADPGPRIETVNNLGFNHEEMVKAATRCMHCDCRKYDNCKLRIHSDQYNAVQKRFFPDERKPVRKIFKNKPVVYEPEKCIKCGICIRIASRYKEKLGLTFIGKGFDVEVAVPFDNDKINVFEKTGRLCAEYCPTGALSLIENEKS